MKNIQHTHIYSEKLQDRLMYEFLPAYDLWSIRPAENRAMEFSSGRCSETERFRNFLTDHSNRERPHELIIIFASAERNYPTIMLSSSKKYLRVRFDRYPDDWLGEPGYLPGYPYRPY